MGRAIEEQTPPGESRPRLLILDPDPRVGEALGLALRREAEVERVPSGMAGLVAVTERRVDLIVAEARLPDVSSSDLVRLFRLLRPRIPIALMGEAPPSSTEAGGNVRCFTPFDLKRCVEWIIGCLGQRPAIGTGPGLAQPTVDAPVRHREIVRWVLEFSQRHQADGTSLTTIARGAGVSRSHLCRIFRRVTGQPLKRFLTRRRLQAAKVLLKDPAMTIRQVASAVGYTDLSHFDRVFRRWEGQTPSSYRRQAGRDAVRPGSRPDDIPWPPPLSLFPSL